MLHWPGIDEAGRGPVLGPMVYGAAFCAVSNKETLAKAAYADSKTLTEDKRDALFEQLKADAAMGWMIDSISAETLSAKMLRKCVRARRDMAECMRTDVYLLHCCSAESGTALTQSASTPLLGSSRRVRAAHAVLTRAGSDICR